MKKLQFKRLMSLLLSAALLLGNFPVTAFAQTGEALCEHHPEHTECGYTEGGTDCSFVCELCAQVPEESSEPERTQTAPEPDPTQTTDPEAPLESTAVTELDQDQKTDPACTGLADCSAAEHADGCLKGKAEADKAAADAVAELIAALPSLEQIQAKPMAQQTADYEQVQTVYGVYCTLTADQQALLPPAEEVFKPYFDYFNSLVSLIWSGSGTSAKPFLIYTEQELRSLAQQVNSGNSYSGVYFKLANNITLTSDWVSVGTENSPFRGSFDGNGMTISGMTITGSHAALFAYVGSGAVIRNVNLTEFSVIGETYVAGLIAHANAGTGSITIADCSVDGTLRDNDDSYPHGYLGGIVAYANAESGSITITGCVSRGSYKCDIFSGGIIGYGKGSNRSLKLRNCTNRAYIDVYNDGGDCGGVAGYLSSAEVTGCMNYGDVYGNAFSEDNGTTWLGGIAGDSYGTSYTGCGNYGEISTFFAGGITPAQYGSSEMHSCLNIGEMTHSSDGYGSALIYHGSAQNSFYLAGTGSGITGATSVSARDMADGAAAHALRGYFGQTLGVDPWPVPLTDTNRVYKVTLVGEVNGTYYVNHGKAAELPELSECAAYYLDDSKFDLATPVTRDYALVAKSFHNYVDGVCTGCGSTGSSIIDAGICGESAGWVLYSDGRLKISGTGPMTNYSSANPAPWAGYVADIKSVEVDYGVTTVGNYAFKGMANIASFTLADTVTRIGDYAFNGVTALTSVEISDYITDIGNYAFSGCTAMTELTLGDRLKTIGNYAFSSCYGLERLYIPSNVTALGEGAFRLCKNLSDYWGGNGLTTIGAYALADTAVPLVQLYEDVAYVGAYAFGNCEELKKVIFYGDAPAIADTAFSGVTADCLTPDYNSGWDAKIHKNYGGTLSWAIDKGELSDSMPWIIDYDGTLTISGTGQMYSFSYSSIPWEDTKEYVRSAVIGDGITSIGDYAFYGCTNLSSISIPDSVTQIGSYSGHCFQDTALTRIPISRYVTKIEEAAFFGAKNLTAIDVDSSSSSFSSSNGVLFNRYGTSLLCYPAGKTGAYTIPANVSSIGDYAFAMCDNLTQITIPANVGAIGNYAFGYCDNLHQITFAGNAPTIYNYGFYQTTADVYVPAQDSTWTPDNMKNYWGDLTWYVGSGTCGTGVQWKLVYENGLGELTIFGNGAMDDYTMDTVPWKNHVPYISRLVVSDGVTHVGAYILAPGNSTADDTSLTKVTLADSVTSIGDHAFFFCTSLNNVSLGNGIQTIGEYAFSYTNLASITLPDSLRTIGTQAFSGCRSLKSLTFGSSMQSIGSNAFLNCTGLQTVDLGGITTLEQGVFTGCTGLTSLVIPASVTSIGKWALRNCTGLQYVEFLGDAPSTFDGAAFAGTTCNAYYSSSKSGWTSGKLSNYGGTITWGVISQRGTCGSKAQWFLDTAGNLFICGSGSMTTYSETSRAPWYDHRENIKMVMFRGVTSVGSYAFADCTKLQAVIFDGNAPSFGTNAFAGTTCEMWYPSTASGWTSGVRKNYGGTLTWRSTTNRGTCGGQTRWALDSAGTLVILGTGAMTDYYNVNYIPWYDLTNSIKSAVIGGEVTNVGRDAFWNCEELETVTIGDSVTTIVEYAFNGCGSLREVTMGENVTTIGTRAFSYCPALKTFTIGAKVTSIDSMAFAGCTALESVTFLGNAPGIAYNAFQDVVTTAYYPLTNTTWTSGKKANYNGTITWVGVCTSHNPAVSAAKDPTCTETGLTEGSYCSICSKVLVAQEVIPARGHFAMGPDNTQVPADSLQPDCTQSVVCTVCNTVVKAALGHRIKAMATVQKDPLTVTNSSAVPFTLTNGTYYSANKDHNSVSELRINVQYACTLSLSYGVSSESNYDNLIITKNGTTLDTISGEVSGKTTSLSLASGDVVIVKYQKDYSQSNGQDRGWVTLTYSQVTVEDIVDVPADTGTPDCTTPVVCEYCDAVVKEALGHRVILQLPPQEAPFTVINTSAAPFTLTNGVYYSTNKTHNSTSDIQFLAMEACTLTLNYGVSSEEKYDKLSISLNNAEQISISGQISNQTLTLQLAAGDRVTVRYSKDVSVSRNEDEGWVSVTYEAAPTEQIVPADTVEADCDGVSCDFCQVLVKEGIGHEMGDWTVTERATCVADGTRERSCSRGCGYTETEAIPMGEHAFTDGVCIGCGISGGTFSNGVMWRFRDGVLTVSGSGEIPAKHLENSWAAIADQVTKVVVEEGITKIGNNAFSGMNNLSDVTLPEGLTTIDTHAFMNCSSLTQITLPDSLTTLGQAFSNCGLTSIHLGPNLTQISSACFSNCDDLTAITVSEDNAHYSSQNGILFSKDQTELVSYPANKEGTEYDIPASVSKVHMSAFHSNRHLTRVSVPEGITELEPFVFNSCVALEGISLPESLQTIGNYAFTYCEKLGQIRIPGNVTTIGENAFVGTGLTEIDIGENVQSIHSSAFAGCEYLEAIHVSSENTTYCDEDGVLFSKDKKTLITYPEGKAGDSYIVPEGVTAIADFAFWLNNKLTGLTLPDSLETIGKYSLVMSRLQEIVIPENVTSIDYMALGTSSLKKIRFLGDCPDIAEEAFKNVTANAYYPDNNSTWTADKLQNYGGNLTWGIQCGNGHSFVNHVCTECGLTGGTCGTDLTWTLEENILVIYGTGAMANYQQGTAPWYDLRESIKGIKLSNDLTSVGKYAFYGLSQVTALTTFVSGTNFPTGVTAIGESAFSGCSGLKRINLSQNFTTLGNRAFEGCTSLSISVDYRNSVFTVYNDALLSKDYSVLFSAPSVSGEFRLNDETTQIADYAFAGNTRLWKIESLSSLSGVGQYAFDGCTGLREFFFRGTAPVIGGNAFRGVTATGRYVTSAQGWDTVISDSYGGNLTWKGTDVLASWESQSGNGWSIASDGTMTFHGDTLYEIPGGCRPGTNYTSDSWYPYRDMIKHVVIPASAYNVSDYAFNNCRNLESVIFEGAISTLGQYAFSSCPSLTEVTFEGGVTSLGEEAFSYCTNLKKIYLHSSGNKMTVGKKAFYRCYRLEEASLYIWSSIGASAFEGCTELKTIYINSAQYDMSNNFLPDATAFTGVTATVCCPYKVRTLSGSYGGNLTWKNVDYGTCGPDVRWSYDAATATLTLTGTGAISEYFSGSYTPWLYREEEITSIYLSDGITDLPSWTFEYCEAAQTVRLPDTLLALAPDAFNNCGSLNNLLIPRSVTKFYGNYFNRCSSLSDLYYLGTAEEWAAIPNAQSLVSHNYSGNGHIQVHCLQWTEESATCTEAGMEGHYAFAAPSAYTYYFDAQMNRLDEPAAVPALQHDMGDWNTTQDATCTVDGSKTRSCKRNCGHTETEVISSVGHKYESVITKPTCEDGGYTTHTCRNCGDSYQDSEKAALGHSMGIWNTTLEPTCTQEGSKTRSCDRDCGHIENEVIPSSGHNYEAAITKPTCESIGYTTHTCSGCGDTYKDGETAALGHDMGEWEVVKEANCTETGIRERNCKRDCGVGEPQEIPINNRHIFDGGVCTLCGITGGVFTNGVAWTFRDGVLTVSGSGEIPSRTEEDHWSALSQDITAVVIEEGVTQIGSGAFGYMDNLQSVTLPEGLTRIGSRAFFKCKSLTEAKLPESLAFIEDSAFSHTRLTTVSLGANVQHVSGNVFAYCDKLHGIKVSEENATYCAKGFALFSKDGSELLTYPAGNQAGMYMVPGSVTRIHSEAFAGNNHLIRVDIPDGVTKIEDRTFASCGNLSRINLPDSITTIGQAAFTGCALTEIRLGKHVQSIDLSALQGCAYLSQILVDAENSTYCDIDGVLFSKDRKTLLIYPRGILQTRYEVPEGTTVLADKAFWANNALEQIVLPDSLTEIGEDALFVETLKSITIPANVEVIGERAFSTRGLNLIRFLGDCPLIGERAFANVTATAYYPADNTSWNKENRLNYGGKITWVGIVDAADSITLSSETKSVFVGQEFTLTANIVPADSTVKLIYETDDLVTVKRVMGENRDRVILRAVKSGVTTVKVTDRISGQTGTVSLELKDPVRITSPHRSDYRQTGDMYYVFTPTQTMQYMVSLENLDNYWSTNVHIDIREQTTDEAVADSVLSYDLDTTRLTATLEAGKEYLIHINNYGEPLSDVVLRLEPVQTVTGINIAREEMTVWIDELLCWNLFTIPVEFLPDQAMGEVTWTSSDPSVITVRDSAQIPCNLNAQKAGTAVITVSCGSFSDQVTVTVKYAPELTLGVPMENVCDYGIGKVFKFTAAEDGIYIFSAESEADLYLYANEHSPNDAEGNILMEMRSGETAYFLVYGENAEADQAEYTVRVDKAGTAERVDIRFTFDGKHGILAVYPSFEPEYTLDPMVKLEVTDPGLFSYINCNPCDAYLQVKDSGSTTVTITTEKGLTASRTVRWGTWGDNISWLLDGTGTLAISGSGDMLHYRDGQEQGNPGVDGYPWHRYADEITSIVVEEGMDSLSELAFHGLKNLTDVTLPDSLDTIGNGAFAFCTALEGLTIPENVSAIGKEIFYGSTALKEITFTGNAPELDPAAFGEVTIMSRYPADNDTWTEDVLENYGGQITWTGYCKGPHTEVTDAAKDPTCTETGLTAGSHCSACSEVLTEQTTVPATGHSYAAAVTDPTCTEAGYTTHSCAACGDSYVDSETEALGHDMGDWTDTDQPGQQRRDCSRCDYFELQETMEGGTRITLEEDTFVDVDTLYADGIPYPVVKTENGIHVDVPEGTGYLVSYTWHIGDAEDIHTQYPVGMKVYQVEETDTGSTAREIPELENLLRYSGSSIRITGNKGIRMITSITNANKAALTGAGLAGFTLVEYGTALCWTSDLEGGKSLILGQEYTRSNYAYKKGVADPVFAYSGDLMQYTNVLVGFSLDQCRDDIAMRPYIILEDGDGNTVTLYGGTIHRSIGYIAWQNRTVFSPGNAAYDFIWEIIHHVYGDQYDEDYQGT